MLSWIIDSLNITTGSAIHQAQDLPRFTVFLDKHQYCTALHRTALHWTVIDKSKLYCTTNNYTAMLSTKQHCTLTQYNDLKFTDSTLLLYGQMAIKLKMELDNPLCKTVRDFKVGH